MWCDLLRVLNANCLSEKRVGQRRLQTVVRAHIRRRSDLGGTLQRVGIKDVAVIKWDAFAPRFNLQNRSPNALLRDLTANDNGDAELG